MRNLVLVLAVAGAVAGWAVTSLGLSAPPAKSVGLESISSAAISQSTSPSAGEAVAPLEAALPRAAESESPSLARSSVDPDDIDWRARALDYVARTDPGNDVGHRTVLQILKRFVDSGGQMTGVEGLPVAKAEDVEQSPDINPTGHKLSQEERSQLSAMLSEFSERKRAAKVDLYIATQIETSRAVIAGDFDSHPHSKPGENNMQVLRKAREAAAKEFDNPRDENLNSIPGVDGSTYRVIILKPRTAPSYFGVKQRLRSLDAEEAIALRSFFFAGGQGRR